MRRLTGPDSLSGVLEQVSVTRYVTPLREGGSLPALVEADNLGTYVLKFRGAGQGPKALVAEIIGGELARRLALRTPELVLAYLDPRIASTEPDPEIQDLLRASDGLNVGVDFLPGSAGFDPAGWPVDAEFASRVLWFDALIQNVDRTWRNPNLLVWHGSVWLIDHGSALYFQHNWPAARPLAPFDASDHVLRGAATQVPGAHEALAPQITPALLDEVLALVPPAWFGDGQPGGLRRASAGTRSPGAGGDPLMAGGGVTSAEPYEYALIRVVPRVERGEAMNAGVILYCQQHRYLGCRILLNEDRLRALDPGTDLAAVAAALGALEEGCRSGPAAGQPPGVRFRWLTATRSTIVQPGPVHSGLTADPAAELDRLFNDLVR